MQVFLYRNLHFALSVNNSYFASCVCHFFVVLLNLKVKLTNANH